MDSSVSGKDEIWFLRVCHHVPHELYQMDEGSSGGPLLGFSIVRLLTVQTFPPLYFLTPGKNNCTVGWLCYTYRVFHDLRTLLQEVISCVFVIKKVHINMCPVLDGYGVMTV